MLLHDFEFFFRQLAGLEENPIRNADLAKFQAESASLAIEKFRADAVVTHTTVRLGHCGQQFEHRDI